MNTRTKIMVLAGILAIVLWSGSVFAAPQDDVGWAADECSRSRYAGYAGVCRPIGRVVRVWDKAPAGRMA